jgi:coenzyme F420-0:L-glutamate ligase/coenzyme F420-1:gamma-L-glutamate ligase
MMARSISLTAVEGLPLISEGDDLGALLAAALRRADIVPADRDVLVVAQKVVSKAEGRCVSLADVVPSACAQAVAEIVRKDARLVELILSESTEIIRERPDVLIVAHRLGYVMANAGVDQSNVAHDGGERALLLPLDPDASAARLKQQLDGEFGVDLGVVINDSFGRPWRKGVVGVALGAAGIPALQSLIGAPDLFGRKMRMTEVAVADQLAAAASLLMGEANEGIPAVLVRGVVSPGQPTPASVLLRPKETDLFR